MKINLHLQLHVFTLVNIEHQYIYMGQNGESIINKNAIFYIFELFNNYYNIIS